ncbi:MAG: hypothetical protein LBI15_03685 [Dysgonamonadaceae bacterium]|jgi:hypothetical protein|nr:hypothetical protein [Dysgonamonadaceae bacterium]
MKNVEKYISNNKNLFEEEPNIGHFKRFQQKATRKRSLTIVKWSVSIAASICILVSVGTMLYQYDSQNNMTISCENAPDIRVCYLNQMIALAEKIETLTQDFDKWDRTEVMLAVQTIIDSTTNSFLESELPDELPEDRAHAILSDYYQRNLQGLELIAQAIQTHHQ